MRSEWVLPTQQNLENGYLLTAAKPNLCIFRDIENFVEL